jgi:hypothetical protein
MGSQRHCTVFARYPDGHRTEHFGPDDLDDIIDEGGS